MSSASYVVVALSSLASSPSRRHCYWSSRRRRVALSLKLSVTGARAASLENPGARDDKSSHMCVIEKKELFSPFRSGQTSRGCATKYTVYPEKKNFIAKKRICFEYVKKALLNMVYKPTINGARRTFLGLSGIGP
jgi:hypothetical protein